MKLLVDANVLIDYCDTDPSVLSVYSSQIQPIVIPSVILDEVNQLDESDCAHLGMAIIEEPLSILTEAAASRGALSFEDRVCLIMSQKNGWSCATNDRRLNTQCANEGVNVIWGLRIMVELVANDQLSREEAIYVVNQMRVTNPYLYSEHILESFETELDSL